MFRLPIKHAIAAGRAQPPKNRRWSQIGQASHQDAEDSAIEEDPPPGVPEWVVTYGDMMSLLLTFFIMLVSMSEIVADKKYRAILESLHSRMGYQMAEAGIPGDNFPLNSVTERATVSKLGSVSDDDGHGGIRTKAVDGDDKRVSNMPDGSGRQVGQAIRFADEAGALTTSSVVACERYALELRGKPNKLELRSWIAAQPVETRRERVLVAFDRAATVREKLLAAGVEPERIRIAVVPGAIDSELINSELSRNGVVTLTVMDAYTRDYSGRTD